VEGGGDAGGGGSGGGGEGKGGGDGSPGGAGGGRGGGGDGNGGCSTPPYPAVKCYPHRPSQPYHLTIKLERRTSGVDCLKAQGLCTTSRV
jgi:hypothetical protein